MRIAEAILPEFDREMATTRRMLERFPEDKVEWRPHETCMTMGRLAGHVAELAGWVIPTMAQDKLEIDPSKYNPNIVKSGADAMKQFDDTVKTAREAIAGARLQPLSSLDPSSLGRMAGKSALIFYCQSGNRTGGFACFFLVIAGQQTRIHRDEGRRKNAFAKEILQQIGNAKCSAEGVGHGRIAEVVGKHAITNQARDAAKKNTCRDEKRKALGAGWW